MLIDLVDNDKPIFDRLLLFCKSPKSNSSESIPYNFIFTVSVDCHFKGVSDKSKALIQNCNQKKPVFDCL